MTTCVSAKSVFQAAMWGSMKWPMFVMTQDTTVGCPLALANTYVSTKLRWNMKDWNCSPASMSQNTPRTICSVR